MLENYKFIKKLGEGSYGSIDLVQNCCGEKFALKIVKLDLFQQEPFPAQISSLQNLEHPNIIKLIDYEVQDDTCYLIMEYGNQGNMAELLSKKKGRENQELKIYFSQILEAGLSMQEKGVIHRDLKPENIIVFRNQSYCHLKISDFGEAKVLPKQNQTFIVDSSFERGTANYAAPQLLQNSPYSSKCDIWSFGCIIYEWKVGHHPFKSELISQTVEKVKKLEQNHSVFIPEDLDDQYKKMIQVCLQFEENERASWRQLKLSRVLEDKISGDELVRYFRNLSDISRELNKQIWNKRKAYKIDKLNSQSLSYFLAKFEACARKNTILILKGERHELQYLYNNDPCSLSEGEIKGLMEESKKTNEALEQLEKELEKRKDKETILEKLPKRRDATFASLDYSIKFANIILKEIITHENMTVDDIEKEKGIKLLAVWANFLQNLRFQHHTELSRISSSPLQNVNKKWIELQQKR